MFYSVHPPDPVFFPSELPESAKQGFYGNSIQPKDFSTILLRSLTMHFERAELFSFPSQTARKGPMWYYLLVSPLEPHQQRVSFVIQISKPLISANKAHLVFHLGVFVISMFLLLTSSVFLQNPSLHQSFIVFQRIESGTSTSI